MGVRGSSEYWEYELIVGGVSYFNDEISDSLTIAMSTSSDGFSVGQCSSTYISGEVPYHNNDTSQNAIVLLYRLQEDSKILLGQWFIKGANITDNAVLNFTANDAMAFIDNPYPFTGSIMEQTLQAESVLSSLSSVKVSIDKPSTTASVYPWNESEWTIRQLLENISSMEATNYYVVNPEAYQAQFKKGYSEIASLSDDDCSSFTVGMDSPEVTCVRLFRQNIELPILEAGEQLSDYGIYEFYGSTAPTTKGTIQVVNPLAYPEAVEFTSLPTLIGKPFGTEFTCPEAKVDRILSPFCQIQLQSMPHKVFYVSSASYRLTTMGIYATLNGTSRSVSDYQYIGKTEKQMRTKVNLNAQYGDSIISQKSGIYWTDSHLTESEWVNNG